MTNGTGGLAEGRERARGPGGHSQLAAGEPDLLECAYINLMESQPGKVFCFCILFTIVHGLHQPGFLYIGTPDLYGLMIQTLENNLLVNDLVCCHCSKVQLDERVLAKPADEVEATAPQPLKAPGRYPPHPRSKLG